MTESAPRSQAADNTRIMDGVIAKFLSKVKGAKLVTPSRTLREYGSTKQLPIAASSLTIGEKADAHFNYTDLNEALSSDDETVTPTFPDCKQQLGGVLEKLKDCVLAKKVALLPYIWQCQAKIMKNKDKLLGEMLGEIKNEQELRCCIGDPVRDMLTDYWHLKVCVWVLTQIGKSVTAEILAISENGIIK